MIHILEDDNIFGIRVKQTRLEKNWTLSDLSLRSGVAVSTLSGIENGKTDPQLSTLKKLAEVLEVNVDWLIGVGVNPHGAIGEAANELRLEEVAIANLKRTFPNDDLGRSYSNSNEWMLGGFAFFPEAALNKENALISNMIRKMVDQSGPAVLYQLDLSSEGKAIYEIYQGDLESYPASNRGVQSMSEHSTSEYVNELDHYVVNKILASWKFVELLSNYLRAVDVGTMDLAKVKACEITTSIETQIMEWIRNFRKDFIETSELAFPTYSDSDKGKIKKIWGEYSIETKLSMEKIEDDHIENEFSKGMSEIGQVFEKDSQDEIIDELERITSDNQNKE